MNKETYDMIRRLIDAGIEPEDAWRLRRIAMTLHRWHEMECGVDNGCIEREESDPDGGRPFWRYSSGKRGAYMADHERGALKRLDKIMSNYPGFAFCVQGDPRGAALYIIPRTVVEQHPVNQPADDYYTRGIAVYK